MSEGKRIRIVIRYTVKPLETGRVRFTAEIESVTDGQDYTFPEYFKRLFLYKKPPGDAAMPTDAILYTGILPVHVFNEVGKPVFGTHVSATWDDLPHTLVETGPDMEVDAVTMPSDTELGEFAQDRLITSSAVAFITNNQGVDTLKARIKESVTDLAAAYKAYTRVGTMTDTEKYPEGWQEVAV